MPEAKTFGPAGPPAIKLCLPDADQHADLTGVTPDAINANYDFYNAPAVLLTVNIASAANGTLVIFSCVLDDGTGTYEIDIDGVGRTPLNFDILPVGASCELSFQTVLDNPPGGPHVVTLKLINGQAVKVYNAYLKAIALECLSVG